MRSVVTIEEVRGGKALARFAELPAALDSDDPRFATPVAAWERYRLDSNRNPFFEAGDGVFLLARRGGRPVGRVTAQVERPGAAGGIGFWWVDDDPTVAQALLAGAATWLRDQGCTTMTGPLSFTRAEEVGVQVDGFDVPGLTGRPWHPPRLAAALEADGFTAVEDHPSWRLPVLDGPAPPAVATSPPGQAGRHADPRLVLEGIAAVPDVSGALRSSSLRGAWSQARQRRDRTWETAVVVRCEGDPAALVPSLQRAAGAAGYGAVIAPWSPDPTAAPETVHRAYRRDL